MSKLYELPNGWEWKKLGDICGFIRGPFGGSLKKDIFKESGFAVYEQSHAIYNQFENIRYFIDEAKFEEMKRFELKQNSLIMSCSGTIGKVAIVPSNIKKGIINQALLMLTPIKNLNNVFLKLLMESNFFQDLLSENSTGAAISNVASVKVLKVIEIPLPKFSEQQRIVSKLDLLFKKIDKSIELHKKNMDEANAFMGSVLNEVFGELEEKYKKELWGNIVNIKNGKHYIDVIDENGKYPIYGSGGIMNYANQYICNENSVIIGRKGTINNPLFIKEKFWNIDTAFGIESNINRLIPMFLFYFCKQFNFLDLNKSTTLPSLAKSNLLQISMVLPPLPIQHKVVEYLDSVSEKMEKVKSIQKEKMESLKALKSSILDKAFRGEL